MFAEVRPHFHVPLLQAKLRLQLPPRRRAPCRQSARLETSRETQTICRPVHFDIPLTMQDEPLDDSQFANISFVLLLSSGKSLPIHSVHWMYMLWYRALIYSIIALQSVTALQCCIYRRCISFKIMGQDIFQGSSGWKSLDRSKLYLTQVITILTPVWRWTNIHRDRVNMMKLQLLCSVS